MMYYTGFKAEFIGNDFEKGTVSIFKQFKVGDIVYSLYYNSGFRIIHVRKSNGSHYIEYSIMSQYLEDTWCNSIETVCQKIIDCKLPDITA